MLRRWSVARLRAELGALEATAERAGAALACAYSSSAEFEASEIQARRAAGLLVSPLAREMRVVLWATALTAVVALAAICLDAF
jgi:hypothetical protein